MKRGKVRETARTSAIGECERASDRQPLTFVVALQLVSTHIAAMMTGRGLTENLRKHDLRPVLYFVVARFLLANLLNIVGNVMAMGVGMRLLCRGGHTVLWTVLLTLLSVALQRFEVCVGGAFVRPAVLSCGHRLIFRTD